MTTELFYKIKPVTSLLLKDNDDDNYDPLADIDIDAILNGDDGDDDKAGDDDDADDDAQKSKPKKKDLNNDKKNYQELLRQQSEDMNALKKQNEDLQKSLEEQRKITDKFKSVFSDDDDKAKEAELEIRKKFQADAPNEVKKMIKDTEERILTQITKTNLERDLKDVYRDITKEYEVDLDKIPQDVLETVDLFSKEARKADPKKVILASYAMRGKLKKRNPEFTNFEGTGSNGKTMSAKQKQDEADMIKERLTKGLSMKSSNVFGIPDKK